MGELSIPLKVLYDALDTNITLEVNNGEMYTGKLSKLEDTMNVILVSAKKTTKSGRVHELKSVFIRGSTIVFFQLSDALQTSPALVKAGNVVSNLHDARGDGKGFGAHRSVKRGRE